MDEKITLPAAHVPPERAADEKTWLFGLHDQPIQRPFSLDLPPGTSLGPLTIEYSGHLVLALLRYTVVSNGYSWKDYSRHWFYIEPIDCHLCRWPLLFKRLPAALCPEGCCELANFEKNNKLYRLYSLPPAVAYLI